MEKVVRLWVALGLLGLGCTRDNPLFDEDSEGPPGSTGAMDATVGATSMVGDSTIGPDETTTTVDPTDGESTDGPQHCQEDEECRDELWCNGAEKCLPDAPGAGPDGCVADGSPCPEGMSCVEDGQLCVACAENADVDQDTFDAVSCKGNDCNDNDDQIHPGATEVCDAESVDEDCNPSTYGAQDMDMDGADWVGCCNSNGVGVTACGTDCDDEAPWVQTAGNDWAHCSACAVPCGALQACMDASCIAARRVFITSTSHSGMGVGGLAGGDAICEMRAGEMGLGGTFMAYLDGEEPGLSRLETGNATDPYIMLNGVRIADDWADLFDDDPLINPFDRNERRELVTDDFAWTGVGQDPGVHCMSWTTIDGEGFVGMIGATDQTWDGDMSVSTCMWERPLYCIEQGP